MVISVVSPIYQGENVVNELVQRLVDVLSNFCNDFEIILVEDGSSDNSWVVIQEVCKNNSKVKGIKLSKNFGQHNAIIAGLGSASGDWVVVMDCDLQDKPEEIPELFRKSQEGYDLVFAQRKQRQDPLLKKMSSKFFYKIFGYLTNTSQDSSIANFGIYNRKVINAVLEMKDRIKYFPIMVQWVGFNSAKVEVRHSLRFEGKSSYSWLSLLKLASLNIIAFSDKPLRLTAKFGFIMSLISFFLGLSYLLKYLNGDISVLGFTSIIITISFFSGLIIFTLGIIGIYLGKTFEQVKDRPNYIIQTKLNIDG